MRDITLLIAHPDDEAIFLWPFLDRVKRIVCSSSDLNNRARVWCKARSECLAEVCMLLGCEVRCEPNDSEFYRQDTRSGNLKNSCERIMRHLNGAEIVATHNAWGEYGHIDHLLCHHIARTHQARHGGEMLVTDIAVTESPAWLPILAWRQSERMLGKIHFGGKPVIITANDGEFANRQFEFDGPLFDRIKAIYDARGCWTWSFPVQEKCKVYSI